MIAMNKVVLKIDFMNDEMLNLKYLKNHIFYEI